MTVAFVAEQLAVEFPDCYAEFSDFMRKKRFIGLVNDVMSRGELAWFLHRGQRRIAGEALDAFLAAHGAHLERIGAESQAVLADPARAKPIAERYPLSNRKARAGKRRRAGARDAPEAPAESGPSLGEIE